METISDRGLPLGIDRNSGFEFGGSIVDIEPQETSSPPGVEKCIIFGPGRFREDYVVRHFTVEAGARTPFHTHDRPHYVIILEGTAEALIMGETLRLEAGPGPMSRRRAITAFKTPERALCIVPRRGDQDVGREGHPERS
jgi:hypothetical protein